MGSTLIIWLFALAFSISTAESIVFENFSLERNLQSTILRKNNIAGCLRAIFDVFDERMTTNIQILIEAQSEINNQYFVNAVKALLSDNHNRFTFDFSSEKDKTYEIHIRMFFVDSLKSFKALLTLTKQRGFDFESRDHFYLIILPRSIPNHWLILKAIFDFWWKLSIVNVDALVEDINGTVTLYTFFPFTKHSCKDSSPKVLNHYANGNFTMQTSNFPVKTSNFWNCPMNVVVWEEHPFSVLKRGRFSGLDGIILEQLANMLNFSINIVPSSEGVGHIFDNQTLTGGFKMLQDGIADILIGDLVCTQKRQKILGACHYNTYYKKIVFRTDIAATSLKTLLLPFDQCTWFVMLAFSITKWFTRPIWNNIANERQKRHYNWFIIVPYLIGFLILRSLYEGSLFKILHNRPSQALPNNLEEAIRQGYKFMVTKDSYTLNSVIPELKKHMVVFDFPNLIDIFFQQDGKYAFFASKEHMAIYSNGRKYFMAQKPLMSRMICIYLSKFSYLTDELYAAIENLRMHGYMDKMKAIFLEMNLITKKEIPASRVNFSLTQLMGAFDLFYILIAVSVLVFALEVLSKRYMPLKILIEFFEKI